MRPYPRRDREAHFNLAWVLARLLVVKPVEGPLATNSEWSPDSRMAFHTLAAVPSRAFPKGWTRRYLAPVSPQMLYPSENILRGA